jgi:hypothetical protein
MSQSRMHGPAATLCRRAASPSHRTLAPPNQLRRLRRFVPLPTMRLVERRRHAVRRANFRRADRRALCYYFTIIISLA